MGPDGRAGDRSHMTEPCSFTRRAVLLAGLAVAAGPAVAFDGGPAVVDIAVPAIGDFEATRMPAQVFRPAGAGPFPVVIFSHGRASKAADRAALAAPVLRGHVDFWVRRGFAVVAPIRPGYGAAGGVDRERSGTRLDPTGACGGRPRLDAAARAAGGAVRAAIDWTRRQTWADGRRLLLVGQSVGGLATVVAAAENPPGVVGYVNFSGGAAGYPKERPGASCGEAEVERVFRRAGRTTRVPSLWLYAENDRFWGAEAPRRWHAAFAAGGSATRLVVTAPVPDADGHQLLRRGGRLWSAHVGPFVAGLGLAETR